MNVIFLDFDGVLNTIHCDTLEDIEKRIAILSDICKSYNCKVVIEASAKVAIDEDTLETDVKWINNIFELFKKYGIECIGRTPNVSKKKSNNIYLSMWKEDEIRLYLLRHPEIEHYCIIDDNDTINILHWKRGDLEKVKSHLVETIYCSDNPLEEGLLPKHKEEVGKVLQRENEIRRMVTYRKERNKKR